MHEPGLPADLARDDRGTITGSWREVLRDGRRVSRGYAVTIGYPYPYTFAAQKGCTVSGGLLIPISASRYRIEHYKSGFGTEGCGPWRAGPEIAPFDGADVTLTRRGLHLFVVGGGHSVELVRLRLR